MVIRDIFKIVEFKFFIVVDKWVMSECEKNDLMLDEKMKRMVFGD